MTIPFNFDAIPQYFRKNGWLDPKKNESHLKMYFFIGWCFSRCSSKNKVVFHDHREIMLEPFEFIFGRRTCSEETGLSEQEIRTLINQLNSGYFGEILKKSTNSVTNRFTCYKWATALFSENSNQQSNQPLTNRQPTDQPQTRTTKILRSIESTTPPTSSKKESSSSFFDCLKEIDIPEHKKIELTQQFTELRVQLAVNFVQHKNFVPTKSVLDTLFWHCQRKYPPEHSEKPKPQWEVLAHKHNEIYAENRPKAYAKNKELIQEQKMMIWVIDGFSSLSLANEISVLKEDFARAQKEYKTSVKNWLTQKKPIKLENFA